MTAGVIRQIRQAASNRAALFVGCMLGGFVPLATYFVAHEGLRSLWQPSALLVLGGLVYSAKTVWAWGKMAFACPWKATGFVLLVEGVMVTSTIEWLAVVALSYLVGINAVATGCTLAQHDLRQTPTRKRKSR